MLPESRSVRSIYLSEIYNNYERDWLNRMRHASALPLTTINHSSLFHAGHLTEHSSTSRSSAVTTSIASRSSAVTMSITNNIAMYIVYCMYIGLLHDYS